MKAMRYFALTLAVCILSVVLIVGAIASNNEVYQKNISAIANRAAKLSEIMDLNSEKDPSSDKYFAIRINAVVVEYANSINALRAEDRVAREDIRDEVETLYQKGRILGECASIYEYGVIKLDVDGAAELLEIYCACTDEITSYSDAARLEAAESSFYGRINISLYGGMIQMLVCDGDSAEVSRIVSEAVLEIERIAAGEITGISYDEVYLDAKRDIELQRQRERAEGNMKEVYELLFGKGSYVAATQSDSNVSGFLYTLEMSGSLSDVNAATKRGVSAVLCSRLSFYSGEYVGAYRDSLLASIEEAVLDADRAREVASVLSVFEGFSDKLSLASKKDELCDYAEGEFSKLQKMLSSSEFLSQSEKEGFLSSAKGSRDKLFDKVKATDSKSEIERIRSEFAEEMSELISSAERRELQNAKIYYDARAEALYKEFCAEVEALGYIGAQGRAELLTKIQNCFDEYSSLSNAATRLVEMRDIFDMYSEKLTLLGYEGEERELAAAKVEYTKKLAEIKEEAMRVLGAMEYLSSSVSAEALAEVETSISVAQGKLERAKSLSALSEAFDECIAKIEKTVLNAENANLIGAVNVFVTDAEKKADNAKQELSEFSYISESQCSKYVFDITNSLGTVIPRLKGAESLDAAKKIYADYLEFLDFTLKEAKGKDFESALSVLADELESIYEGFSPEDYTDENYSKLSDIYNNARREMENSTSVLRLKEILSEYVGKMKLVQTKFDAAKGEARKLVEEKFRALEAISDRYAEGEFNRVRAIYEEALSNIDALTKDVGASGAIDLAKQKCALMESIKIEWVSSGEIGKNSSGYSGYPAGFEPSRDGMWGIVTSSDGMPYDISLIIGLGKTERSHEKELLRLIRGGSISYVGPYAMSEEEIAELLGDYELKGVCDVKLIKAGACYDEFSGRYRVKILLPDDMRKTDGLKLVYIGDDGRAEFFDAEREGGFLVFETEHFSEFLIVGEKKVDLLPLIIFFGVIGLIEGVVAFCVMLYRYEGKKNFAVLSLLPVNSYALSVILPRGAGAILAALIILDILLGVYLFFAIRDIILSWRGRRNPSVLSVSEGAADREEPSELKSEKREDTPSQSSITGVPRRDLLPMVLESVSAEEADELLDDKSAEEMIIHTEENTLACRGCKKVFINVDTISDNFKKGDTVSLEELKNKGLVPKSACFVKVLARGRIDKPLIIKAQAFSTNAVKMIALTGGSAILSRQKKHER